MWIVILTLLAMGLALIIAELVFIPGTTVVGLLGFAFAFAAVLVSYSHFGKQIGFYMLLGSLVITAVAVFFSFRTNAWSRFALANTITSKVNEGTIDFLKPGDEGTTLSTLRPIGKVVFQDKVVEAKTTGNYLDQGQKVKVTALEQNQIIVEPII